MFAISIENWSNIFKEISQGRIDIPTSELPTPIFNAIKNELTNPEKVSYGTWLEIFARLDDSKEGLLNIEGFNKEAKEPSEPKGRRVRVESGIYSQKKFTQEDKAVAEAMRKKDPKVTKKQIRNEMAARRQNRKEEKEKEKEKSQKALSKSKGLEDATVEDAGEDEAQKGGNENFGSILNFVITELFERAGGTKEVESPFRKGVNVNYNTILNNYTPPKLDAQRKSLDKSVEDTKKELEDKGGADSPEGKKYKKYVTRVEKQLKAFDEGRAKAEGLLKKVQRDKQKFYVKMKDNAKVVAIAERYAQAKKAKPSATRKRDISKKQREQKGREDTKFLKRLVDKAISSTASGSTLKTKLEKVEYGDSEGGSKKAASLTLEQAQMISEVYAHNARVAQKKGSFSERHAKQAILAKALEKVAAPKTTTKIVRNRRSQTSEGVLKKIQQKAEGISQIGDRAGEIGSAKATDKKEMGIAGIYKGLTTGANKSLEWAKESAQEIKDLAINSGMKFENGEFSYDDDYWNKDGDKYTPKEDMFKEDGTKKTEEDLEREEREKSSYKNVARAFTKIFLDKVLEDFKKNGRNEFESPFKEGKKVSFDTLATYASNSYWKKEIEKAKRRKAKDIDRIEESYKTKKEQGKQAYDKALVVLGKFREEKANDAKYVYDLAKSEMTRLKATDPDERGWTWAGLTAGIQNEYGGAENKKAKDINEELGLNLKSPKDNKKEKAQKPDKKKKKNKTKSTKSES